MLNEKHDEPEMAEIKLDVVLMTRLGGKEIDEKVWKQLFLKAGFIYYKIFPQFGLN